MDNSLPVKQQKEKNYYKEKGQQLTKTYQTQNFKYVKCFITACRSAFLFLGRHSFVKANSKSFPAFVPNLLK